MNKIIFILLCVVIASNAQETKSPPACIAVKSVGSHAFRNIMLGGIAGALISKEQYQVLRVVNYPALSVGSKVHGTDLQTMQNGGTKVVILTKRATVDDIIKACAP